MSLLAKIASLRQVNINAHAEIEKLQRCVCAHSDNADCWEANCDRWEAKCDKLNAEIETLKLTLADRDEEVKSLRHFFGEHRSSGEAHDEIKTLHAENKTLKLTLADRDEEVKSLKLAWRIQILDEKSLKDEIEALKLQLADGDRSTLSTHEHHRELRDKLNAEIDCLTQCLEERDEEITNADEEVKSLKEVREELLCKQKTQAKIIRGMGKKITELQDDAMRWRMLMAWEKATNGIDQREIRR